MHKTFWLASVLVLAVSNAAASEQQLDASWNKMIQGLQRAQHHLTDPASFPPESTDRNLAEGYRYLLAHLGRIIESEMRMDPRFPEFLRSMDMLRKWTGENPDTMYLKAPIDASGYYKVVAKVADPEEWRTSARGVTAPKAPRLVTFQTITSVPGSTGGLAEMAQCKNETLDFVSSFNLVFEGENQFEILIGPKRPAGYQGNFLTSQKLMRCASTGQERVGEASWLSVREIFSDWENEVALDMDITRLDALGESRPPINVQQMAEKLALIGRELPNQIHFWNLLQEQVLEIRRDVNGDGVRAMPVNGINQPAPPFTAGGVAGARQYYAAGKFELAADEVLVIKVTAPLEPHYIGFQLNNLWFEGPDQQNYVSSLTGHQLPLSSDGSRYYVVAHEDPGVQGWVDTTGYQEGSVAMRFVFREDPAPEEMPTAEAFHLKLSDLASALLADTPRVSPQQRKAEIAIRQAHIKKRWRAF